MTQKEAVYNILKSRKWTTRDTIIDAAGESGLRRARELRQDGYTLKTRKGATGTEYRLAGRSS